MSATQLAFAFSYLICFILFHTSAVIALNATVQLPLYFLQKTDSNNTTTGISKFSTNLTQYFSQKGQSKLDRTVRKKFIPTLF